MVSLFNFIRNEKINNNILIIINSQYNERIIADII
jgi:hypothetical protein